MDYIIILKKSNKWKQSKQPLQLSDSHPDEPWASVDAKLLAPVWLLGKGSDKSFLGVNILETAI